MKSFSFLGYVNKTFLRKLSQRKIFFNSIKVSVGQSEIKTIPFYAENLGNFA